MSGKLKGIMPRRLQENIEKHPMLCGFLALLFVSGPEWLHAFFGLFTHEPFFPWLKSQGITMPHFTIAYITAPVSVAFISWVFHETKKTLETEPPVQSGETPAFTANTQPKSLNSTQIVLVIMATICALYPFLRWIGAPSPHLHVRLLTFDQKAEQNIWLRLTNDCFDAKDPTGLPFKKGMAGIVAVPLRSDVANDYLQFTIVNDSSAVGNVTDISWQWKGNHHLKNSGDQSGWQGNVADLDRGFSDSVVISLMNPIVVRPNHSLILPPLQFKPEPNTNVIGIAEIRITGTDFPEIVYEFGIQHVTDSNPTAYVVEESITRTGLDVEFTTPHRQDLKE
jgi:hypothetical protein